MSSPIMKRILGFPAGGVCANAGRFTAGRLTAASVTLEISRFASCLLSFMISHPPLLIVIGDWSAWLLLFPAIAEAVRHLIETSIFSGRALARYATSAELLDHVVFD